MVFAKPVDEISTSDLLSWGIKEIIFDTQEAQPGSLFCALVGIHTDGHRYIQQAKSKGVKHFLVSNNSFIGSEEDILYILCEDTRASMALLSSVFYEAPSRKMYIIGVTGTDGKSTTVQFIMQLIQAMGHECGLISTVSLKVDNELKSNNLRQSTPEAPQIEKALSQMLSNGITYAVIEATSHGLSDLTGRLSHITFRGGVFTNVTIEHLEFHKTVEQYRDDKANLFRNVARHSGFSVINNLSDHAGIYIEASKPALTLLYGTEHSDLWAENIVSLEDGLEITLKNTEQSMVIKIPLVGHFNIENVLAALLTVSQVFHSSPFVVAKYVQCLQAPAGRMMLLMHTPFRVIIDYAHTPGAFEKLLPYIRDLTKGKVIVLFGSGGERNLEKRSLQGKIADIYADIIFLTNEDPRLEDEFAILNDIARGIERKDLNSTLFMIPDRARAIDSAVHLCKANDTLLLLGKGHEQSIIGPQGKQPWDEVEVVRSSLRLRGFI